VGALARLVAPLIGSAVELPEGLAARHPELQRIRLRRGGLPVRVGGWALGQRTVAAITLWSTVYVAPGVALEAELLLHELRHVDQFQGTTAFPVLYIWESLRRGYMGNRFEVDARAYAAARLGELPDSNG